MGQIISFMRHVVCVPIKLYQFIISPLLTPCCRFYPSCSEYALLAIHQRGIFKGSWLAFYRLLRCHPWSSGGFDPVLPTITNKENH